MVCPGSTGEVKRSRILQRATTIQVAGSYPLLPGLATAGLFNARHQLEIQIHECQIKAEANIITVETVIKYLLDSMRLLKNKNPDTCKRFIPEYIEKIIVTKEKIEVLFKITVDLNGGGGPYIIVTKVSKSNQTIFIQ